MKRILSLSVMMVFLSVGIGYAGSSFDSLLRTAREQNLPVEQRQKYEDIMKFNSPAPAQQPNQSTETNQKKTMLWDEQDTTRSRPNILDTRTGTLYQSTPGGYINTRNGRFIPTQEW